MAGDIEKEYGEMKTITVSITRIRPPLLFLIRWAAKLASARIVICKSRRRQRKEG